MRIVIVLVGIMAACNSLATELAPQLTITWADNWLTIRGKELSGGEMRVQYIEAYCRPGSTDRDWAETVIGHKTRLISSSADGKGVMLRCELNDGVIVDHEIDACRIDDNISAVDFRLTARNPTDKASSADWAQPCINIDKFTGRGQKDYLHSCFIYIDHKLTRLPTQPWAEKARYIPGQVYCPAHVDRNDVNPRPLSSLVPSNGLIGCFSSDGRQMMAVAWEPYQELFQGVRVCIHSDFRLGGLQPSESKSIRGRMYFATADANKLLKQYESDFPEHKANGTKENDHQASQ